MIRQPIWKYVRAGIFMRDFQTALEVLEQRGDTSQQKLGIALQPLFLGTKVEDMSAHQKEKLENFIGEMIELTGDLGLSVSQTLLFSAKNELPKTEQAFNFILLAIRREMNDRLFVYIPLERAQFFEKDDILSPEAKSAFPNAYLEIREAANCYAAERYTACVFHSMRGAEIGLRALGNDLNVSFPNKPIELAEWQNIIEKIESEITKKMNSGGAEIKDENRKFYGQAAAQFRYFKDGWRIRTAHAREVYLGSQALNVLTHTRDFFEDLKLRLKE